MSFTINKTQKKRRLLKWHCTCQ